MTEPDLIRKSQQGDRAAFESLLRLWARPIYAWLLPHVRDTHLAEDLTQETLLRAWKSIRSLEDPSKFKGWIFSIANRTLIDHVRFTGRDRRSAQRTVSPDIEIAQTSREIDSSQSEILRALERLPATYREVLSLRFLSGLSPREIEQRLGITNGSLRGLLHRGLKMLRDELEPIDTETPPLHEIKP